MTVPYSSPQPPTLGQIKNVSIDPGTLANGQVIAYDATANNWKNSAGGGGGGAIITGTNDAVVFKNGTNGDADSAGITRTPGLLNYTAVLDTANKRLGINKSTPSTTLDVNGIGNFVSGTETLAIDGDELGLIAGTETLKLYSHNITTAESLTEVDADAKKVSSSTLRSKDAVATDAPNGSDDNGFYKIRLNSGFPQQAGGGLFDQQENYDPTQTQFPTGQQVEYQNSLPLNFPVIIGRTATGVSISPASVYVISNFGSTFAFQDRCLYDPCQMRSRKSGTGWVWAGAPVQYRTVADVKAMLNVRWYFEGRWSGSSAGNRLDMYVNQFRSGALLRTYLVAISNNADSCFMSGERTFLGHANLGEDIDWSTDDFQVEIANQTSAGNNITVDLAQVELKFILAQ